MSQTFLRFISANRPEDQLITKGQLIAATREYVKLCKHRLNYRYIKKIFERSIILQIKEGESAWKDVIEFQETLPVAYITSDRYNNYSKGVLVYRPTLVPAKPEIYLENRNILFNTVEQILQQTTFLEKSKPLPEKVVLRPDFIKKKYLGTDYMFVSEVANELHLLEKQIAETQKELLIETM